jgi:hypothetical protein
MLPGTVAEEFEIMKKEVSSLTSIRTFSTVTDSQTRRFESRQLSSSGALQSSE